MPLPARTVRAATPPGPLSVFPAPLETDVRALLQTCDLPTEDLDASQLAHFLGCGARNDPCGVVGVELHGQFGLLRSLAVREADRNRGCGRRLVASIEGHARSHAVRSLYLLTTTAQSFFATQGYAVIERDAVPPVIRTTQQFATLCPQSAVVMCKVLRD